MSNTPEGANLDAAAFDLDAWIDGIERPTMVVELYPHETAYAQRLADIERRLEVAETADGDRGMDDATPETLAAQLAELRAERERETIRVRVRQPTQVELTAASASAKKAGAPEGEWLLWGVAAATVAPGYDGPLDGDVPQHFTGPQLTRLARKNRSGEVMVGTLIAAVNELLKGPPVPS